MTNRLKLKLPASIAEQVKLTQFDFERKLGHDPALTEDIILYIKDQRDTSSVLVVKKQVDGREKAHRPHLYFSHKYFHNYYFSIAQWRAAREAHCYCVDYLVYKSKYINAVISDIDKDQLLILLPYRNLQCIEFFTQWTLLKYHKDGCYEHTWHVYSHMKPFAPDPDQVEREMLALKEEWREKIAQARAAERLTKWEHQMFHSWVPFSQYAMLLICSGEIERLEEELAEYLKWWHHYEGLKPKPNYWDQISGKVTGGHLPIIRFQILLPIYESWLQARRANGPERLKLAEKALGLCYQWMSLEFFDFDYGNPYSHRIPEGLLFSMMMRLDLGLDLETCQEFIRYFKPYLTVFPHIREKLEALNVAYDPPQMLPQQKVFDIIRST